VSEAEGSLLGGVCPQCRVLKSCQSSIRPTILAVSKESLHGLKSRCAEIVAVEACLKQCSAVNKKLLSRAVRLRPASYC
jgi:hypothetical protein